MDENGAPIIPGDGCQLATAALVLTCEACIMSADLAATSLVRTAGEDYYRVTARPPVNKELGRDRFGCRADRTPL